MNRVDLIGRLTADAELRYNNNNVPYTRVTLAVNRRFLNANGEREADFINCIAWRKTAEIICEHFNKGSEIGASGRIQTGSYEKEDGTKVYTTDVIIEEITFIGSKNKSETEDSSKTSMTKDPFAEFGESVSIDDNFLD